MDLHRTEFKRYYRRPAGAAMAQMFAHQTAVCMGNALRAAHGQPRHLRVWEKAQEYINQAKAWIDCNRAADGDPVYPWRDIEDNLRIGIELEKWSFAEIMVETDTLYLFWARGLLSDEEFSRLAVGREPECACNGVDGKTCAWCREATERVYGEE